MKREDMLQGSSGHRKNNQVGCDGMLKWVGPFRTIENVNDWLNQCSAGLNHALIMGEIKVDLSALGRLSPVGCTVLASTLDFFSERYKVNIVIPQDTKIIGYLERMNFFKTCNDAIKYQFENQTDMERLYRRNRFNQENRLLEITKSTDPTAVDDLYNSIVKILRDKAVPRDRVADIANIVSELGNNALEHTECLPYSCIQHYESTNTVRIALCDLGLGIFKSLKHAATSYSSDEVIAEAILTNASRHVGEDRGKGLVDVKSRAFNFSNVRFYVRTHDTAYIIYQNHLSVIARGRYFFGTYFDLEVQIVT